jgi:hypothetical protein
MDTKQQARALMMRHHKMIKNRQQSMLGRAAAEIGMDIHASEHWTTIQGKPLPNATRSYDRSHSAAS